MRDPALHIKRSDLIRLITPWFGEKAEAKADELFRTAKGCQIKDRHIVTANAKSRAKLQKQVELETEHVEMFHRTLQAKRIAAKHQHVRPIYKNDAQYTLLKELAQNGVEFAQTFDMELQEGFNAYFDIGLRLIGKKYGLNKFKYYKEKIFEVAESLMAIDKDEDKEGTQIVYKEYCKCLLKYGKVTYDEKKLTPEKYVCFIYARQEADDLDADLEEYVKAQFEGLQWLSAVPEVNQMYGDNARLRYETYKAGKNTGKKDESMQTQYSSEAERRYYERMRSGT